MNFKDSQDQIDLRLSHTNFSGLSLSQQGNDVLIQAPYNGNTSTIKIIGAQVADFDAADFIF